MARMVQIKKGPSKFDLMVSLFQGHSWERIAVEFQYEVSPGVLEDVQVYITALEREDGSGECWLYKGFVKRDEPLERSNLKGALVDTPQYWKDVEGFYSSQNRTGTMKEFVVPVFDFPTT